MYGNSSPVSSAQQGVHERLEDTVRRHLKSRWQQPVAAHNASAFDRARERAADFSALVLDSGCGTGRSSLQLAGRHPGALVIGIDQSHRRTRVLANEGVELPDNVLLLRAECADFWRLALAAGWQLAAHYLLYPNPWPKPAHLKRRWHGHPVFPDLLALGGTLVSRSNWPVYLQEMQAALALAGRRAALAPLAPGQALTDFEAKYAASGQPLWELISRPD